MIGAVLNGALLGGALALSIAGPAAAQTLTLMKGIDAPHYDAQRTTWGPTSDIPTPNRMKDAETDEWLKLGRAALTEADRAKYYAMVQQKVMQEHLWIPVLNINMHQVANKNIKGARPHMIYQNTFYKGLDASL
jgi:ABC-type transport system substrate-binding protein